MLCGTAYLAGVDYHCHLATGLYAVMRYSIEYTIYIQALLCGTAYIRVLLCGTAYIQALLCGTVFNQALLCALLMAWWWPRGLRARLSTRTPAAASIAKLRFLVTRNKLCIRYALQIVLFNWKIQNNYKQCIINCIIQLQKKNNHQKNQLQRNLP